MPKSLAKLKDTFLRPATGVELIAAERQRQITVEGWTHEHDDRHVDAEMARAAATYAMPEWFRESLVRAMCSESTRSLREKLWPWEKKWWKPTRADRVRELVKAGALIAAEIDRVQRAARLRDTTNRAGPGDR